MSPISRRDFLKLGSLSLLSTAFLPFESATGSYQEQPVIFKGSSHYNRVALTYDDCYLASMLRRLEGILENNPDVRITLFPVGEALLTTEQKEPGIWRRFQEMGHEIGYHSFDHNNPQVMSAETVVADYERWLDALQEVLKAEPAVRFARPPFGNTSPSFLHMCAVRGLVPTMWSTGWGGDPTDVVNFIVPNVQHGDIVLLHTRIEDMKTTEKALPALVDLEIKPVTMSRLYLDWLKEQSESQGCYIDPTSPTRTCIE